MGYLHTAIAKCLPGNVFKKGRIYLANDVGDSNSGHSGGQQESENKTEARSRHKLPSHTSN